MKKKIIAISFSAIDTPCCFAAILNGLRMGFKSLAIEEHASEVAKLLGAVKTDFAKFSELLEGVRKNGQDGGATL